jgi:hypothetical protein
VKSNYDAWRFKSADEIRWLFAYPIPLFLACVDEDDGLLSIYQTMPRFLASFFPAPTRLQLQPTKLDEGECAQWDLKKGRRFSLSAPILRVSLGDFRDKARLGMFREVMRYWVALDTHYSALRRVGLLRFQMPDRYSVNEVPSNSGTAEQGMTRPTDEQLAQAVRTLFQFTDCVGDQLRVRGDRWGALQAVLLLRHLRQSRAADIASDPHWRVGWLSQLEREVCRALNDASSAGPYAFEGVEKMVGVVKGIDFVADYLNEPGKPIAGEPQPVP